MASIFQRNRYGEYPWLTIYIRVFFAVILLASYLKWGVNWWLLLPLWFMSFSKVEINGRLS